MGPEKELFLKLSTTVLAKGGYCREQFLSDDGIELIAREVD